MLLVLWCTTQLGCSSIGRSHIYSPFGDESPSPQQSLWSRLMQRSPHAPLAVLPGPQLEMNTEVRRELAFLLKGRASFVQQALERRMQFEPVLYEIFRDQGLHPDLLNVALIESGFKLTAKSSAGASGPWQFMSQTARMYGLRVERGIDQRQDLVLSTLAAARHLRDLYAQFRDWNLVLAAYNAGPSAVERAMRKVKSNNFWTLARQRTLRDQTARYVPRFIAACLIVRRAEALSKEHETPPFEVVRNLSMEDFHVASLQGSENWTGARYPSVG